MCEGAKSPAALGVAPIVSAAGLGSELRGAALKGSGHVSTTKSAILRPGAADKIGKSDCLTARKTSAVKSTTKISKSERRR